MDELANLAGFPGANYPLGPLWYPNDEATHFVTDFPFSLRAARLPWRSNVICAT